MESNRPGLFVPERASVRRRRGYQGQSLAPRGLRLDKRTAKKVLIPRWKARPGGSVQPGLSTAFRCIDSNRLLGAMDKRYSLGGTNV